MGNDGAKIGYRVNIDRECIDSEHSYEPYGDWSEVWSNHFESIHTLKEGQSSDVNSEFSFAPGDPCFVVWVEYSSGDSFGSDSRGHVETVGVFKTFGAAQACEEFIIKRSSLGFLSKFENGEYLYPHPADIFVSPDGQTVIVDCSAWTGYFESLDEVNIEATQMQGPTDLHLW